MPYGDDTAEALAAVEAVRDKVADYFMRCKLIAFDDSVSGAVDISAERIGALPDGDLTRFSEEIAACPLARPGDQAVLPLREGINPAWQEAFDRLRALVLDRDFPERDAITEAEWLDVVARFAPYAAWLEARKGGEVEGLGVEAVRKHSRRDLQ